MIHGLYFRFYQKFNNVFFACVLAKVAYCVYCSLFFVKKIKHKKRPVSKNSKEALDLINRTYPRLNSKPVYSNPSINSEIDLSVVIPVYNYADIIEKNIDAILNQKTKYNYRVIIVDDGSTDGAADIIRQYQDNPKVKLIFQKNAGIGAARNTGINAADGKYLMFIDCDDVVHEDIVEVLMNKAYSEEYDMVMCAHNLSKERNGKVYQIIPNIYPSYNLMGYKNGDEIMNLAGLPWGKVYKRELWNDIRFFPGYWYEDTIIQFLVFPKCNRYAYIPKVEYEYKWYEKNFSHIQGDSTRIKTIDSYWILIEILNHYGEIGLPCDDALYTLVLRHISSYYYSSIKGLDAPLIEALFVLAGKIYKNYKPQHKVKLPFMLRQVEKAFDNNDIGLWKLASCYQ